MKTKFYLLLIFIFFTLAASAQKYNVMYMGYWTNNAWTDTLKTTATYDANGRTIKIIAQTPNAQTKVWENKYTMNYTWNTDATIQQILIQIWDPDNKVWEDATKTTFTYNASKKMLSQTTQLGWGGLWMDLAKTTLTYNTNNQVTVQVDQTINPLTMQLTNSEQITFTYNPDGTVLSLNNQTWNGQWVNSKRSTNTYNTAKLLIATLEEKWQNNAWLKESNITMKYNANDSISESLQEKWENNAWVNDSKSIYTYNTNKSLAQVIYQDWNKTTSLWVNAGRLRYDYSTAIQPIELVAKSWKVFPNPFNDQLTIENVMVEKYGLEIFNANGQMLKSFSTSDASTTLNLGELAKGVYFMKIKSAQNEQTIKLLKSR